MFLKLKYNLINFWHLNLFDYRLSKNNQFNDLNNGRHFKKLITGNIGVVNVIVTLSIACCTYKLNPVRCV